MVDWVIVVGSNCITMLLDAGWENIVSRGGGG